jgi:hypothetical protein
VLQSGLHKTIRAALLLAGLTTSMYGSAATYYVDAEFGRDTWTGRVPTPTGTATPDGPWQSLAKISATTLAPGDVVMLRCDRRWAEPLRIGQSGSAALPISIRTYGTSCAAPPSIDGATRIPAENWTIEQAHIYRATLPINLVTNGRLAWSIMGWRTWATNRDSTIGLLTACPANVNGCLQMVSGAAGQSVVHSGMFPVVGNVQYTAHFYVNVPAGVPAIVAVRRAGPTTFEPVGLEHRFTGTGSWQRFAMPFTSTASLNNARFDLSVFGSRARSYLRDVRVEQTVPSPHTVMLQDRVLQPAHHPNAGHDPLLPTSQYARVAADSDIIPTTWGRGSTYLTVGPDLALPAGASITPGLTLHIRSENWQLDKRTVTAVTGDRLTLNQPSHYRLFTGWGYLLMGARWMLDSPDEWHFDPATSTLTAWLPDGSAPGNRISIAGLPVGIDLSGRQHVTVDGIAVNGAMTGVSMAGATGITLSNLRIENTGGAGVDAKGSVGCRVLTSAITRTTLDAISGTGTGLTTARDMIVTGNRITDSGVHRVNGVATSVPSLSRAAIDAGTAATVSGNEIRGAGYIGVRVYGMGVVSRNYIGDTCLILDDCGGVYVDWSSSGTHVTDNLIERVHGNYTGTPYDATRAVGVYIDERSTGSLALRNTIRDADYGIQIHNAFNNRIEGNTLFASRRQSLWLQERTTRSRPDGDIYGNLIKGNIFYPTNTFPAIRAQTPYASTWDFATYEGNTYFALLNPRVVTETWATHFIVPYTFPEWQAATVDGVARNNDITGRAILTSPGYAAMRVSGSNLVTSIETTDRASRWSTWNQTAPFAQFVEEPSSVGPSRRLIAGATESLLASPHFTVLKDQWYRVSYDVKGGVAGQRFTAHVLRGGGGLNGYESLMGPTLWMTATTGWTRQSFIFKANATINLNDPITLDYGARLDFEKVQPGQTLSVANVEVVPIQTVEKLAFKSEMIVNTSASAQTDVGCPDEATDPGLCSKYVKFADDLPVTWPHRLQPLASAIIFTRDQGMLDSDQDGIPDSQDRCPLTGAGLGVLSNGCAIGQVAR